MKNIQDICRRIEELENEHETLEAEAIAQGDKWLAPAHEIEELATLKDILNDRKEIIMLRTHTDETLTRDNPRLIAACEKVALDMEELAIRVREENAFGSHVTEQQKDDYIKRFYTDIAIEVRNMENLHNFSVWQRVNTELTGECIGFLSERKV